MEQAGVLAPQCIALLGLLALSDPRPSEVRELEEKLFPNHAPDGRRNSAFRKVLSRLRQKMGATSSILQAEVGTLRLQPEIRTDLQAFREAIRQRRWEAAIGLYTGDFLPQLDAAWADDARAHLRQTFLDALVRLADLQDEEGDLGAMLDTLGRWRRESPSDEEPLRRRWTALVRSGQRALARAEARQYRTVAQEIASETRQLIARLELLTEPASPAHATLKPLPLPLPWTGFIGRERAVEIVLGRVLKDRVVSILGEGGMGKTRLALEVAHQLHPAFGGQVAFVELGSLSERAGPESIQRAILRAIGRQGAPPETLLDTLQPTAMLLLLDNAEHLWESVRRLVRELLEAAPELRMLITSRRAVDLTEERSLRIEGLPPSAARALFLSASPVEERLDEPEEAAALDAICQRLEGWPLALECAAAQRRSVASLVALEAHLSASWSQARTEHPDPRVPERARTLEATLAFSEHQLEPRTRRVWRAAAVFVGGWTVEGLAAVAKLRRDVLQIELEHLEKAYLVRRAGERFRMLEPVRDFALARLQASSETDEVIEAHAHYFVEFALATKEIGALDAERENLEDADAHLASRQELQLRLRASLWRLWHQRGNVETGYRRLVEALTKNPLSSEDRREALLGAAALAYARRDPVMELHAEEARVASEAAGDQRQQARATGFMGLGALVTQNYPQAQAHFEAALALFEELGDSRGVRQTRGNLTMLAERRGDLAEAERRQRENLTDLERENEVPGDTLATELNNLIHTLLRQEKWEQASAPLQQVLSLTLRLGLRRGLLQALSSATLLLSAREQYAEAALAQGGQEALAALYGQRIPVEAQAEARRQEELLSRLLTREGFVHLKAEGQALSDETLVERTLAALKKT